MIFYIVQTALLLRADTRMTERIIGYALLRTGSGIGSWINIETSLAQHIAEIFRKLLPQSIGVAERRLQIARTRLRTVGIIAVLRKKACHRRDVVQNLLRRNTFSHLDAEFRIRPEPSGCIDLKRPIRHCLKSEILKGNMRLIMRIA